MSLKARLTFLVLLAVLAVWLAATAVTYRDARHEIDELLDAHLAQAAALLIAQTGDELEEIDTEHMSASHPLASRVVFQVWEHGKRLRLHSLNAPRQSLGSNERGFSEVDIEGQRWRVYSDWDREGEMLIHVGELVQAREEIARQMLHASLTPLVLALPLLGILVWFAVRSGVRPLDAIADQVARRAPDYLQPLQIDHMPPEIAPLVERLNNLFAVVASSIESERRFTADAAHELRTPLAAIRAQAQVALGVADETERRDVLHKVIVGCDRTARLMEQLLTMARLDTPSALKREPVSLRDLAARIIGDLAPLAVAGKVEIELEDGPDTTLPGNPGLLHVLLRNLLDNAVRYSPPGGRASVSVTRDDDVVTLAVSDVGPGIPERERARVTDRFYRVAGTDREGSGLGLSIVARIVELHGGKLQIESGSDGKGTTVAVTFPLQQPS